jgi:crotonobetainyl-CoA:carnitine CoA-transferase CaiB-like acyl-CoA transferase
MTADALEEALHEAGLPYGRVSEVADVLKDPHIRAREMLVDVDHHGKGTLPLVNVVPNLSKTPGSIRSPSPLLGQHNEEVYCGLLDLSKEELRTLKEEGVI